MQRVITYEAGMSSDLIHVRDGSPLDHLALCCPDTRAGIAKVAEITGVTPELGDPEPGQFYWSGGIPLGQGRFLEILGPNPNFRGFNPFMETIRSFDELRPAFWYVGTRDFAAFREAAKAAGAPVQRIETIRYERDGNRVDYQRGILGPGFKGTRPCVIQWNQRPPQMNAPAALTLRSLRLSDPDAVELRSLFATLGIDQPVAQGPAHIAIDLDTPNGPVSFEGPALAFEGIGAMAKMASLYLRHLFRRAG
ncbi:VOC family protein [Parasphingopyxis sp.]|uniref:VOC family protein n=1 Tax=Parasphingopyxis sp. TaxID=1920299 RepID=UPI002637426C|nr:VOC family protein [Parasphingopyxis sp.]